jgi:6-phosphogluconolactonase
MIVNRRTFSTLVASAIALPRLAFAQAKTNCAFYSGVGGQLTHFEVDFDAATLAKRAAVTLPGGIQYAWPHPSRRHLYVATSSGGVGIAPVPGYPPDQHYLVAFRVTPLGELSLHGDPIKLRQRPVHASVDSAGEYVLVAYNFPSNVGKLFSKRRRVVDAGQKKPGAARFAVFRFNAEVTSGLPNPP